MKQLLVILIASCYAFGSTEVSLHFHYCGKVFQYVSLFSDKEKDSCCGETGDKQGCCNSDVVKSDVDDHKQGPKYSQLNKKITDGAPIALANDKVENSGFVSLIYHYSKLHPPPILSTKVYLDNCVFLI